MSATFVYVHGIGNKPTAELLKLRWDTALAGADLGNRSRLAYWAPVRYPEPLLGDGLETETVDSVAPLAGPGLEAYGVMPTEAFVAATAAELAEAYGPDAGMADLLASMAYAADAAAVGADSAPSNFEVLPGPRFVRVAAFRSLVRVALHDVHAYFFNGQQREAIRQTFRDLLADVAPPLVVVAHSLGTVIAYDVLHEEPFTRLEIPILLTLGSPLGITEIQDMLQKPLAVPPSVQAWLNVADGADVVALDPTIRPEYAPSELCTDALVVNSSFNHHGAQEYLSSKTVRAAVRQYLS